MEQPYRTETKVSRGGKVTLTGLPFAPGEEVEVTISRKRAPESDGERYPLRGLPVRFAEPFDSVAEDDWEVLR